VGAAPVVPLDPAAPEVLGVFDPLLVLFATTTTVPCMNGWIWQT
jgi:hypothetical protein